MKNMSTSRIAMLVGLGFLLIVLMNACGSHNSMVNKEEGLTASGSKLKCSTKQEWTKPKIYWPSLEKSGA